MSEEESEDVRGVSDLTKGAIALFIGALLSGELQLLLTMLDGEVALTAEMDAETPEHRASVSALVDSGAVVVPDIRDQDQAGATFYEITPEGEEMLYTKRADSLRTAA